MKKNKLIIACLIALSSFVIVISCTQENIESKIDSKQTTIESEMSFRGIQNNLNDTIQVLASTTLISEFFFNIGVKKITVEEKSIGLSYKFETSKNFNACGKSIDFSSKEFILKDNLIYEKSNPEYSVTFKDNAYFIFSPSNNDYLEMFTNFGESEEITSLVVFLHEIILENSVKTEFDTHMQNFDLRGGCSFWNTYYLIGAGATTSAANANLVYVMATDDFVNGFTCRKLNSSPDVTNWGGFYTSTNTYCCGGGGASGSW